MLGELSMSENHGTHTPEMTTRLASLDKICTGEVLNSGSQTSPAQEHGPPSVQPDKKMEYGERCNGTTGSKPVEKLEKSLVHSLDEQQQSSTKTSADQVEPKESEALEHRPTSQAPSSEVIRAVTRRPQNQGSIDTFNGAREFMVNGGSFNSVTGNMVHSDQIIYCSVPLANNSTAPTMPIFNPPEFEEKDSELYARLLWPKGRGFPLWCPNPNRNLPPEYVESGIRIGDVGIVPSNGEFDFLFNICLPADHPVNGNRVPEGFVPAPRPDPVDINLDTEHSPGSFLMSKSIRGGTGSRTMPPLEVGSDYFFQCAHHDGAILILPEGSVREDLQNLGAFRQYAGQNAESWYRYANGSRGREAVNGSIHLVTGYDKSTSWALGAFSHNSSIPSNGIELKFCATTTLGSSVNQANSSEQSYTYHWNQSGPARTKYGPMPVPKVMNQSLFIRTFSTELGSNLWSRIFGTGASVHVKRSVNMKSREIHPRSSNIPFSGGKLTWNFGSLNSGSNNEADAAHDNDTEDREGGLITLANFNADLENTHPSRYITQYILRKCPSANVALAHHDNWKALMKEGEEDLPELDELTSRLEKSYAIVLDRDNMSVSLTNKEPLDEENIEAEPSVQLASLIKTEETQHSLACVQLASSIKTEEAQHSQPYVQPTSPIKLEETQHSLTHHNDANGTHSVTPLDEDSLKAEMSVQLPPMINTEIPERRGGCWTCRIRRKKCDEKVDGPEGSCITCRRLTLKCLGWGRKRPDWMRDKQAVINYKADIKARLTKKGFIRSQPLTNLRSAHSSHYTPYRSPTPRITPPSASASFTTKLPEHSHTDYSYPQNTNQGALSPSMPGDSNTSLNQFSSHGGSSVGDLDPTTPGLHFASYSLTSSSSSSSYLPETDNHLFFSHKNPFGLKREYQAPPSPSVLGMGHTMSAGQSAFCEERVSFYFQEVHKVQLVFSGSKFTEVTHQAISDEPRGAVAFAICALVDLYSSRVRVREGPGAPSLNHQHSQAMYLQQEAMRLLTNNKAIHNIWTDYDAVAAVHLVSFSQLCGGQAEWETPFQFLCEWLSQTGIHVSKSPQPIFNSMTPTAQTLVKVVLWYDTMASISLMKLPAFMNLWKRLLSNDETLFSWVGEDRMSFALQMDELTGCPDEAMLAIAEVSALAHWKAAELRNGTLSYPKLIRWGDEIERQARCRSARLVERQDQLNAANEAGGVFLNDVVRNTVEDIFRETAVLYLHTVLSDSSPGAPEISASVDAIVRLLYRFPPSNIDRALVFPICLAGCMTNHSNLREFFKHRLQSLDESLGNFLQMRLLMEAMWQKRDVSGSPIDVRELIRELSISLLLI